MTGLRAKVQRLTTSASQQGEIWWQWRGWPDRDELVRQSGLDAPALTLDEFQQLPDDRQRVLFVIGPAPDADGGSA